MEFYPLGIDQSVAVGAAVLVSSAQSLCLNIGVLEGILQASLTRQSYRDVLKLLLSLTNLTTTLTGNLTEKKEHKSCTSLTRQLFEFCTQHMALLLSD